jgi:hypothetical protein
MRSTLLLPTLVLAVVVQSACSTSGGAPAISADTGIPSRFSGTFQSIQQRTGAAAPTGQSRASGIIELIPIGGMRTRAVIQVSTAVQGGATVYWAIHPGRCGSGTLPVINHEAFPYIELSGAGTGNLDAELPVTLYAGRSYHANVYSGGRGLNNVVTCANLRGI